MRLTVDRRILGMGTQRLSLLQSLWGQTHRKATAIPCVTFAVAR